MQEFCKVRVYAVQPCNRARVLVAGYPALVEQLVFVQCFVYNVLYQLK